MEIRFLEIAQVELDEAVEYYKVGYALDGTW